MAKYNPAEAIPIALSMMEAGIPIPLKNPERVFVSLVANEDVINFVEPSLKERPVPYQLAVEGGQVARVALGEHLERAPHEAGRQIHRVAEASLGAREPPPIDRDPFQWAYLTGDGTTVGSTAPPPTMKSRSRFRLRSGRDVRVA